MFKYKKEYSYSVDMKGNMYTKINTYCKLNENNVLTKLIIFTATKIFGRVLDNRWIFEGVEWVKTGGKA
jgi:hypothetical protein